MKPTPDDNQIFPTVNEIWCRRHKFEVSSCENHIDDRNPLYRPKSGGNLRGQK